MFIDNGKKPDDSYSATLGFWLPPDTPYGNFELKYMKLISRLDEINRKISESFYYWRLCRVEGILPPGAFDKHVFANELAIYMLRRATDELISLIWCLAKFEEDGVYPSKIKVDCIGAVLAASPIERHDVFNGHTEFLESLNDISNAFKHSFINSDHTLLGRYEPCVHALGLTHNKLTSEATFYNASLSSIAKKFSEFFQASRSWLIAYSERNR
jgi:hypothetical protein